MTLDCCAWKWEQCYLSLEKRCYKLQAKSKARSVRRWAPSQPMERDESWMGGGSKPCQSKFILPLQPNPPPAPARSSLSYSASRRKTCLKKIRLRMSRTFLPFGTHHVLVGQRAGAPRRSPQMQDTYSYSTHHSSEETRERRSASITPLGDGFPSLHSHIQPLNSH